MAAGLDVIAPSSTERKRPSQSTGKARQSPMTGSYPASSQGPRPLPAWWVSTRVSLLSLTLWSRHHARAASAGRAELACGAADMLICDFSGELAFDRQKEKRNYKRPLTGSRHVWGISRSSNPRSGTPTGYQMTWPPSTRRSTPVTNDAALLSRKMTGPTMSSGWAFLPRGVSWAYPSIASRCSGRWVIGVQV